MLISRAYAASGEVAAAAAGKAQPEAWEAFVWNMGLVLILVGLFYVLLIVPQQRRFKEHRTMLDSLKKGDEIVTGGGLVGKIEKLIDENEVLIDLGDGMKVTALRSTVQLRNIPVAPLGAKKEGKRGKSEKTGNKKKNG